MKSLQELKHFFDTQLKRSLEPLEQQRLKAAGKAGVIIALGLILGVVSLVILLNVGQVGIFMMVAVGILSVVLYTQSTKKYKSEFKELVIRRIIDFMEPGLEYQPAGKIARETYQFSELFRHRADRYNGDDFVQGMIGETKVAFSELHTEYRTTDSKGRTQYHTIFRGIFFMADFNKSFKSKTFVLPDVAESLFGGTIGKFFQSMNKGRGELVKLEDPEFERRFVVYSGDQIEARYILSTSLMARIMQYRNQHNKPLYFCFKENKIFLAISCNKNLFEPKIFMTLYDFSAIREYYEDLSLALSIVEGLNLNLRIWQRDEGEPV